VKNIINSIILVNLLLAYSPSVKAMDDAFKVVVHPSNSMQVIDRKTLADFFLKKKIFWSTGRPVLVVDLVSSSLTRQQFSEQVLKRPVSAIRNHWQQVLFSGLGVPPPEFKTDQEVVNFVSGREDAIGYVSLTADIGPLRAVIVK